MCVNRFMVLVILLPSLINWSAALKESDKSTIEIDLLRIVGGVEVQKHSLPYQAAIVINGYNFCGGSIISAKYILTVAHCICKAKHIQVTLGVHYLFTTEQTQQTRVTTNYIIHGDFKDTNEVQANDIGLIKVDPIRFTRYIQPIKLPDVNNEAFEGELAVLSGWGATTDGSDYSSCLRKVYLTIVPNWYCQRFFDSTSISSTQMCTGAIDTFSGTVGGCYGDSGGPLVKDDLLIGILSFGGSKCEEGKPSVFTKVEAYRNWIWRYSGV